MATRKLPLRSGRGVLATNIVIGGVWYGPSYPDAGDPPPDADIPDSAYDVRANWPTPDDAARVGLDYGGGPDPDRVNRDDETET